jgi:hypothetical protein
MLMQDTPRPENPLLKPIPPEGAAVVRSGEPDAGGEAPAPPVPSGSEPAGPGPAARPPVIPRPPLWFSRKLPPGDVTVLFMLIVLLLVVFPLLYRQKLDHCANDASRWNTVFYLVEYGTYEYLPDWGEIKGVAKRGKTQQEYEKLPAETQAKYRRCGQLYYRHVWFIPPFQTVDMVKIGERPPATRPAGSLTRPDATPEVDARFASSKPPLLSAMVAGVVWSLQKTTHMTFRENPEFIMRMTVILVQVIPFLIMLWLVRQHVVRQTDSPFVQNLTIGLAAVGTYLTPYLIPLNNHLIAACCMMFALHAGLRIWQDGRREWYWFVTAGLFGGLAFAAELPAAVFGAVLGLALFYKAPRRALLLCLPMMLAVIAAYFYTNYQATGSIEPMPMRFTEVKGPYHYEGSYWHANNYYEGPTNIDAAKEPKQVYLANLILGHHGFFSLTPIFFLSLLGIGRHLANGRRGLATGTSVALILILVAVVAASLASSGLTIGEYGRLLRGWGFFCAIAVLAVLNIGMYAGQPDRPMPWLAGGALLLLAGLLSLYTITTNNYAGVSQGPRWLFWVIPMWLLFIPAGVEILLPARWGRGLCYLLAAVSLLTVGLGLPRLNESLAQTDRPYTSTWIQDIFKSRGWIDY